MAWIQVDAGIREHDKIFNLADTLKITDAHAVGLMVCLWTWAVTAAPDGDITSFPPRAVAKAAGWDKKPDAFYEAICSPPSLFVEKEDGRVRFRNWEERAAMLMEALERGKEQTKKRVQRYRERKAAGKDVTPSGKIDAETKDEDVTVTECNGDVTGYGNGESVTVTPLPNLTVPNQTKPNLNVTGESDADASAHPPEDKNSKAKEPVKHKHGQYSWVCLTEDEYQRLIKEFGEATIAHYIRHVDEYVQRTKNKNGYKDWNLVVRTAIRDNWGGKTQPPNQAVAVETDASKYKSNVPDDIIAKLKAKRGAENG